MYNCSEQLEYSAGIIGWNLNTLIANADRKSRCETLHTLNEFDQSRSTAYDTLFRLIDIAVTDNG